MKRVVIHIGRDDLILHIHRFFLHILQSRSSESVRLSRLHFVNFFYHFMRHGLNRLFRILVLILPHARNFGGAEKPIDALVALLACGGAIKTDRNGTGIGTLVAPVTNDALGTEAFASVSVAWQTGRTVTRFATIVGKVPVAGGTFVAFAAVNTFLAFTSTCSLVTVRVKRSL